MPSGRHHGAGVLWFQQITVGIEGGKPRFANFGNMELTGYAHLGIYEVMDAKIIYQCLCNGTRLRILNLLLEGPLCVCHLTEILQLEQPKISRHLKVLKEAGSVETLRCYNWTIFRLPDERDHLLDMNLKCLQDLRGEDSQFREDLRMRELTVERILASDCDDLPSQIKRVVRGECC